MTRLYEMATLGHEDGKTGAAQYNLFTGELEPRETDALPETGWLFDPDFGIVLPEEVAGREVVVGEGVTLAFPAAGEVHGNGFIAKKGVASVGNVASVGAIANGDGAVVYPYGMRRATDPEALARESWVAQTEDAAQLILSGFGIYLGKKS